jgi:hypothetical protein
MNKIHTALRSFLSVDGKLNELIIHHQYELSTTRGHLKLYRLLFSQSMLKAQLVKVCGCKVTPHIIHEITWAHNQLLSYRHDHPELLNPRVEQLSIFKTEQEPIHKGIETYAQI